MKILSLDSATECATVAIIDNDKILGETIINYKKQHSVIMMPMIDNLLKSCSLSVSDIDGFVVSSGPGSFTGLRIGMSTIKGLVQATKKPFVTINSLDGLANNLFNTQGIICPIIDALRGNVYTNFYRFENNNLVALNEPQLLSMEEVIKKCSDFNERITFIGDGTLKFKDNILNSLTKAFIAPSHLNVTKASSIGYLGYLRLANSEGDNVLNSSPLYLRLCQAEREYEEKVKNHD
ncbi:tRNA (adenosine(37)-N6)-threonylcarbamoyltransferase complex dimerization subunit type 1 TsaB [Clostridium subterminale]|uniref:tRNA (Adenosine(37)-N6)-threonylcarbamoyltransferase complex dimerization subunit type 1 TsaB n=1 Tax=Clostridium subterminale TaxID=1550 RepID=A0ABN1KLL4_CLOSU